MQDNICIGKKIRIINKSELKNKKTRKGFVWKNKTRSALSLPFKIVKSGEEKIGYYIQLYSPLGQQHN